MTSLAVNTCHQHIAKLDRPVLLQGKQDIAILELGDHLPHHAWNIGKSRRGGRRKHDDHADVRLYGGDSRRYIRLLSSGTAHDHADVNQRTIQLLRY